MVLRALSETGQECFTAEFDTPCTPAFTLRPAQSFDKIGNKRITVEQASRALDLMKIHMSPSDEQALGRFTDGKGLFDYALFCREMDTVFGHSGLERRPDHPMPDPLEGKASLRPWGSAQLSAEQRVALETALEHCARQVQLRGLIPKANFKDWDKTGWGYISRPSFLRELLGLFPKLSPSEAELIATAFATQDAADVNYRAFDTTVSPVSVVPTDGSHSTASLQGHVGAELAASTADAQAVLDALIRQAATRRIRARDFFLDFDPLHKGYVTKEQFLRGLHAANFDFTGLGIGARQAVTALFWESANDQVHYPSFCEELDKAFTVKGLESAPTATLDTRARSVASRPLRTLRTLSPAEEREVGPLLDAMRAKVASRRIELVNMFKDFDRSNEEHVSEGRFLRVLASTALVPPDPHVQQLLVRKFRGTGSKNTQVCWRAFKEAVDPSDAARGVNVFSKEAMIVTAKAPTLTYDDADARQVVFRIKAAVKANRIRLAEFLRGPDRLREGRITAHQLETGLSAAGLSLTPPEHAALASAYAEPSVLDAAGAPMVRWTKLVEDVEAVFGAAPGLERHPDFDVHGHAAHSAAITESLEGLPVSLRESRRLGAAGASAVGLSRAEDSSFDTAGGRRVSAQEEQELRSVLQGVAAFVAAKRLNMKPVFQDFDRTRRGYLPFNQFARALTSMNIPLSEDQRRLIGRAFATPARDLLEVSYRWFMAAVDPHAGTQMSATSMPPPVDGRVNSDSTLDALLTMGRLEQPRLSGAHSALGSTAAAATASPSATMRKELGGITGPLTVSGRLAALGMCEAELPPVAEVMRALKEACVTRGLRLGEHLRDFDPLRKGHIPMGKFASAVKDAGIHLSPEQLTTLHAEYEWAADATHIATKHLLQAIDGGAEHLERAPEATLSRFEVTRDVGGEGQLSGEAAALVAVVRAKVVGQRQNLKARFQEFDRVRHGVVSRPKFEMVLNTERGLKLTPAEITLLADTFTSRRGPDLIHYTAFLSHVDFQETR